MNDETTTKKPNNDVWYDYTWNELRKIYRRNRKKSVRERENEKMCAFVYAPVRENNFVQPGICDYTILFAASALIPIKRFKWTWILYWQIAQWTIT